MENSDIINTNEQRDSPVYIASPVNSPVNSPVFVSKESEHESEHEASTQFTEKLILPVLNMTILSNDINIDEILTDIKDKDVTVNSPLSSSHNTKIVEMVTVVVKDFKYCQEEFLKQIKENNLSITPETIMRLLRIAMIIVEQTKESGSNKKEFVIKLLKDVVMNNTSMLTEHKLEALNLITGNIVSDSIDFIIDASRGKFDINKIEKIAEEVAKTCFARCWESISKKN
jgi:hypothetical protein